MEQKVWLIYTDRTDGYASIKGYILGTAEEAEAYCNQINASMIMKNLKN